MSASNPPRPAQQSPGYNRGEDVNTFILTNRELQSIASFTAVVPKDLVTPLLQYVQVSVSGDIVTVMGTDRYTAARMSFRAREHNADGTALIDLQVIADYAGDLRKAKADPVLPITITVTEADLVNAGSIVFEGAGERAEIVDPQRRGFFPPLAKLFPEDGFEGPFADRYAPTGFSLDLLGRIAKLRAPEDFTGKRSQPRESAYALRFLPPRRDGDPSVAYLFRRNEHAADLGIDVLVHPHVGVS